ncbi:MAG: thioesterase family protein [Ruminococcus sp.]|nr:thioesterase family protein [Ruminococcus sp.]
MSLNIGDKLTKKSVVTEDMLACNVGSGSLRVLATPMVVALMENAACELAQRGLEDIFTTVGTEISIEHTSPTPIGAEVSATAVLEKIDGRMFYFSVYAEDKKGEIAKGTHTRVSVKSESFQKKAEEKFNG